MKTKIMLILILIIYSNNLFGQASLYNLSASFRLKKTSETNLGKTTFYWNEINNTSFYNLFTYSKNFRTEIGLHLFFLNYSKFNREGEIYFNKLKAIPTIRQRYKFLFFSVSYYCKITTIKSVDYPGGYLMLVPPTNKYERGFYIDAGIQLKIAKYQYIELLLGYEKLRYTDFIKGLSEPINNYIQNNYLFKVQTLSSDIKFSEIGLLKATDIEQKPWLFFVKSQFYIKKDHTKFKMDYVSHSKLYIGKFITNKIIYAMSFFYKQHENNYARLFITSPELKYLFLKSFFTDISYSLAFMRVNMSFLSQSISFGTGNYLRLTKRSILETRLFYSYETIFVGKYKNLYPHGNQINNRIGLNFKLLILF